MSPTMRHGLIHRLATLLDERAEDLAGQMASEIGKPVRFGRVEARRTAEKLRAASDRFASLSRDEAVGPAWLRRRPHGVVGVITPWNNPIYLALGKIACAVLGGNAVVWKPAPQVGALSRRLHRLFSEAGCPETLVRLVEGDHRQAEAVLSDPSVAAVTITGSLAAGERAQEICSRRRIPLQAELGGNNAAIVWPDANLEEAARLIAGGAFEMAGQRCTANRRVIVHRRCQETFLDLLRRECAAVSWGDPRNDETRMGPLVDARQRERVGQMVERAVRDGWTTWLPQGSIPPAVSGHPGAWYPPTILQCEDPTHEIVQEESFGPVLVVQTARDWDHATSLCNGVRHGLAAALFTTSPAVASCFLNEIEAGILKVNQSTADAAMDVPFGGWKDSGVGLPEHGRFDVEFYTRPQTLYDPLGLASLRAVG